jgi:hypothetical protein
MKKVLVLGVAALALVGCGKKEEAVVTAPEAPPATEVVDPCQPQVVMPTDPSAEPGVVEPAEDCNKPAEAAPAPAAEAAPAEAAK